jgi:hypothetical protein
MSHQPNDRGPDRRAGRYEQLLAQRIDLGRLLTDVLCHAGTPGAPASVYRNLLVTLQRLDGRLLRFRQYPNDYLARVRPVEDARWHTPPGGPADHGVCPCRLCDGGLAPVTGAALPYGGSA